MHTAPVDRVFETGSTMSSVNSRAEFMSQKTQSRASVVTCIRHCQAEAAQEKTRGTSNGTEICLFVHLRDYVKTSRFFVFPIAVRDVRLYSTNLSLLAVNGLELDIAAVCVSR
jgi:hypothetical protein